MRKALKLILISAILVILMSSGKHTVLPQGDADAIVEKMELLRERSAGSQFYIGTIEEVGR